MYQAGYRDCWRKLKKGRINLRELNLSCSAGFTKRFSRKLGAQIKKKLKIKSKNGSNIRQRIKKRN